MIYMEMMEVRRFASTLFRNVLLHPLYPLKHDGFILHLKMDFMSMTVRHVYTAEFKILVNLHSQKLLWAKADRRFGKFRS